MLPLPTRKKNKKTAKRATADIVFVANAFVKGVKHHTSGNNVYVYELMRGITFLEDRSLLDSALINVTAIPPRPPNTGGDHGDDIPFSFGYPFNPNYNTRGYSTTEEDRMLSGVMMRFWGEFARSGNIRGWPQYNPTQRAVMQLDRQEPYARIAHDPLPEVVHLWTTTIPTLLGEMATAAKAKQDL